MKAMTRDDAIAILRRHAPELQAAGVRTASLFGSTARGQASPADVDIAVQLDSTFSKGGFDYYGQLDELQQRLSTLLGCPVDVIEEPVRKPRLQQQIDQDRALVF
jgi:predicted nucleotidyltransferase